MSSCSLLKKQKESKIEQEENADNKMADSLSFFIIISVTAFSIILIIDTTFENVFSILLDNTIKQTYLIINIY